MAQVSVTAYEVEHGLLPAVCARCGGPATGRRDLDLHVLDGWRGGLLIPVVLFGLLFFPPLVLWTIRHAEKVRVPVPLCPVDFRWFESRERVERRLFFPIWTAVALMLDALVFIDLFLGGRGFSCVGVFAVLFGAVVAAGLVSRGRVGITKPPKGDIRLTGVHEAFVAALIEDRARARVSDPDRRGGHGDMRDDYDDEVQ